jgi:NitT/TauT family transport system substrate-binding protein
MKKIAVLFTLLILIAGCTSTGSDEGTTEEVKTLRIGTLLIEDVVPFYIAEQEGYYEKEGIKVELIPFNSALERDSALMAGEIDGALSDPVGAILLDTGGGDVKITSLSLGETPEEGVFAILAGSESDINSVDDLKGVEIAISSSTIIEYVTDRMLTEKGFSQDEIKKLEVKKMPIRLQMLNDNQVEAATLPEPLASIAASKGARIILKDSDFEESISQTVIIFRRPVLEDNRDAVRRFFRAYGRAVEAINKEPDRYRDLFMEKGRIPPFLADTYPIPRYPAPQPYGEDQYQEVMDWLVGKGLVEEPIPYSHMVDTNFL